MLDLLSSMTFKESLSELQEIQGLQAKRKREREGEKQLYQRMFKGADGNTQGDAGNKTGASKGTFSVGLMIGGVVIALAGAMAYKYRLL